MIYKTKTKYLRLEKRLDEEYLIEMRGNKIVVNDHTFYVDNDFNITEAITGLSVPYDIKIRHTIRSLEDVEEYIKSIIKFIEEAIPLRIKEGYTVQNFQQKI